MDHFKNLNRNDPNKIIEAINELEIKVQQPQYELNHREDIKVQLRVDETISPGMFKPDPLIPGGFVANSLTIRAMRPDLFVLGESIEDLSLTVKCKCGKEIDVQFWRLCPHCGLETKRLF